MSPSRFGPSCKSPISILYILTTFCLVKRKVSLTRAKPTRQAGSPSTLSFSSQSSKMAVPSELSYGNIISDLNAFVNPSLVTPSQLHQAYVDYLGGKTRGMLDVHLPQASKSLLPGLFRGVNIMEFKAPVFIIGQNVSKALSAKPATPSRQHSYHLPTKCSVDSMIVSVLSVLANSRSGRQQHFLTPTASPSSPSSSLPVGMRTTISRGSTHRW